MKKYYTTFSRKLVNNVQITYFYLLIKDITFKSKKLNKARKRDLHLLGQIRTLQALESLLYLFQIQTYTHDGLVFVLTPAGHRQDQYL